MAQQLLARYIVFLTSLDQSGSFEYCKSLGLALLQWNKFYSEFAGVLLPPLPPCR